MRKYDMTIGGEPVAGRHHGLGVEFGEVGLEAFTNIKVFSVAR